MGAARKKLRNQGRTRGTAVESAEHRQSSFGLDYWLQRCEAFQVEGPGGRIGRVGGIRFGASAKPEVLEVQAGMFGRRKLLIHASEVTDAIPEQRRLILRESPRLLASEQEE
jgi:hypothetical protein